MTRAELRFLQDRAVQRRVAAVTVGFAILAGVYAFLAPKWYTSVLTVVPAKAQQGGGGLSSLIGGDAGGLASGLLGGSMGGGADVQRITAVLRSVAVTDAVIEKLDLRTRYRAPFQEVARETLWSHCTCKALPKPNLVELSCEDKDPAFAQKMLAAFAEHGNEVFRRVNVSSASEEVRFLEKRVEELRHQANEVATRMREFQEEYRIIDLDSQARAVVSSVAALNGQKVAKQLELEYARTYAAGDEATTRQLQSQLSVMGRQLRDLVEPQVDAEPARRPPGAGRGLFPAALEVPRIRAQYETLYRDRRVSEATLIFALERLEGAKATAARDVSTFVVLDPPTLPTKKSRPKRASILLAGLLAGLAIGLAREAWRAGVLGPLLGLARS